MHDVRKQDELVTAVLSRASNARHLATQFAAEVGDPQDVDLENEFPEIASGGFVWRKDLRKLYEVYDEVWPLEGRVSQSRMKALREGATLTPAEKALFVTFGAVRSGESCVAVRSGRLFRFAASPLIARSVPFRLSPRVHPWCAEGSQLPVCSLTSRRRRLLSRTPPAGPA